MLSLILSQASGQPLLLIVPAGESFVLGVKIAKQPQDKLAEITEKVITVAQQIQGM